MSQQKVIFMTMMVLAAIHVDAADNDVETVFKDNNIVPDVISKAPQQFLKVFYANGLQAGKGKEVTPKQAQKQPKVEWEANDENYYTLIMIDPDAPSRVLPIFREFRHWLVVNIPRNRVDQGEVLAAYIGPSPPKSTGLHRYVFLVYKQKGKFKFDEASLGNTSSLDRLKFNASKFAEKYNLGAPIAGNFYHAKWSAFHTAERVVQRISKILCYYIHKYYIKKENLF